MKETHRIAVTKDFRIIIIIIAFCSAIGLFWQSVPILDLFNHFRLQAVAGGIFCAIFFMLLKDKKGIFLSLTVIILNIVIIGYRLHYTGGIPGLAANQPGGFSIVSANVLTSNKEYALVLEMAKNQDADLMVFNEVDPVWIKKLKPLEDIYPHYHTHPRTDNFGLAAYSKEPFRAEVKLLGNARLPALVIEYEDFVVIAAHPLPPASTRNMKENMSYLSGISDLIEDAEKPVIIAGDMNATLWSGAINPLIESGFSRINSIGLAYTWPVNNFLWMLQIDHFFGRNIQAGDFKVLPSVGSDHYPIRADILFAD